MWRDFRLVSVLLQQRTYHRNWFKLLQKWVLYKSYYDSWRTLVIKFHHSTCQTPEMRKIATHKFNILTLKNVTWRTYLISFTVQCCFLFRFVCIELVSLIWFLQIWVAIYVYGTMINWFTLIKKLMQTSIIIVSMLPLFIWMAFDTSYDVIYRNLC